MDMEMEIENSFDQGLITKSFKGFKLKKFPNLSKWVNCTLINFNLNPIEDFQGLQSLPNLKDLYLDNTKLSSFYAVPELPSLSTISIKSTPINAYKKIDIMCSIAFGSQLFLVNGEEIRRDRVRFAQQNRDILLPYLRDGWILTSINPIRFIHSKTRQRLSVKTPSPLHRKRNENEISNNSNNVAKETEKENSNATENEESVTEVAEEGHSEHTVYEASESNESKEAIKAEQTMDELNNNLTKTIKKKTILDKTLIDESRNKKKYRNKESTGIRNLLRRPGGIRDPFTFNLPLTVEEKPFPEIELQTQQIDSSTKKNLKLTINSKPNSRTVPTQNEYQDSLTDDDET